MIKPYSKALTQLVLEGEFNQQNFAYMIKFQDCSAETSDQLSPMSILDLVLPKFLQNNSISIIECAKLLYLLKQTDLESYYICVNKSFCFDVTYSLSGLESYEQNLIQLTNHK